MFWNIRSGKFGLTLYFALSTPPEMPHTDIHTPLRHQTFDGGGKAYPAVAYFDKYPECQIKRSPGDLRTPRMHYFTHFWNLNLPTS